MLMAIKFTIKAKLVTTLCVPLLIMASFFIYSLIETENVVLEKEKENVQVQLAEMLDQNLRGQVDTLAFAISDYYESSKIETIKKSLAAEMSDFRATVTNIYENSTSYREAEMAVYAFLQQHRWNNGRYFFAYDATSFISKAYGSDVTQIEDNGYDRVDANGKFFVRDVIAAAQKEDIGFSEYSFLNPTTETIEDKITASFYFKPLNLVIASGEYVSTLRKENIEAAINAVIVAKYGLNGYFWIQDENGIIIAHPKTELIGTKVSATQLIAKKIQGKQESTVEIVYENPVTKKSENKIAYSRKIFPEWGWIISTGAYENDIIAVQDNLTDATQRIFDDQVASMITSSAVLIIVSLILIIWIITAIVKNLYTLKQRIDTLSTGEADLTSRLTITNDDELGDISHSVNNFIM